MCKEDKTCHSVCGEELLIWQSPEILYIEALLVQICSHDSSISVSQSVHQFGPDWNISAITEWIAIKFCRDIHGRQIMNPNWLCWSPDFPSRANMRLTFVFFIQKSWQLFDWMHAMNFSTAIQRNQSMYLNYLARSPDLSNGTIMSKL